MPASLDPRLPYREIESAFLPARDPVLGYVKVGGKNPEIRYTRAGKPWVAPTRLLNPARFEVTTREKIGQKVKGRGSKSKEDFTVDLGYQRDLAFHALEGVGEAPNSLRIRLMYPTWQQNMIAFLGAYGGGAWVCRGNGVEATDAKIGERACPCPRLTQFEGDYSGEHPNDGARYKLGDEWKSDGFFPCKPHAQLNMILFEAGIFGGFWAFKTTSFETISNLTKSMMMFQEMFERIDGLPLELQVQAVTKQLPGGGTTTQPIVTLVLAAGMDTARQIASAAAAESRKFLPAGGPLDEERYRDAVVTEMEDEAEATHSEFSTPPEQLEAEEGEIVDAEEVEIVDAEEEEPEADAPAEEEGDDTAPHPVGQAARSEDFDEPASAHRADPKEEAGPDKDEEIARAVFREMGWEDDAIESRLDHHRSQRSIDQLLTRLAKFFPEEWAKVTQTDAFAEPEDGLPS